MRLKDAYVIWTVYFDRKLTKKEGRKLPKNKAILKPKLEEILEAVNNLGFEVLQIKDSRYPSSWWIKSGYIVIKKPPNMNKHTVIEKIAKEIRRKRGGG